MAKSRHNIVNELQLNNVGLLELLVAMYPVLSEYSSFLPMQLLLLVVIIGLVILKKGKTNFLRVKEFTWFVSFVLIHEFIWLFVIKQVHGYFINSIIQLIVYFVGVLIITPRINWNKLVGSINWVTIICMIGMFYHAALVAKGNDVGQIPLPFLEVSRQDVEYARPQSFFSEPGAYASFMLYPLFISLLKKQWWWSIAIAVGILASTSTNGIALLFIMIALTMLSSKTGVWSKVLLLISGVVLVFLLFNNDYFSGSVEKIEQESDVEHLSQSVRMAQGFYVVSTMNPGDFVLGVPYGNAYDYAKGEGIVGNFVVYGDGEDSSIYMTTIWQLLLKYGVVGLFLYLMLFYKAGKRAKDLWPLIACFMLRIITAGDFISTTFVMNMIFIYVYIRYVFNSKNKWINENSSINTH